ncbi:MAG: hypothetical protein A3G84_04940 [Chloroflexi bacterium RIFCSPLOWO2_12_FULL_71_12]|nr:MAG: hypothetical protein A2082_06785 [Chloroflexi bacterium GWC2_70_10]OGO68373.1 MAG: hypothetical protein A3H36_04715 [Chloroflexi bacterium RIFCSPLOWO2_02_FULL_71_16]OGO73983.1 MAG: hypothetical protein A3G84_04940 [Chloroflexi bacterium RIFCSPLOWO2_12_FULL_71_12]
MRRATAAPSARPGSTKLTKRSVTTCSPARSAASRTAPISTIRSPSGSNPVVSRSIATSRSSVIALF